MTWRGGMNGLVGDEVSIVPVMEELSNLLCVDDHRAARAYGCALFVDAAPTVETLRLLSQPDAPRGSLLGLDALHCGHGRIRWRR